MLEIYISVAVIGLLMAVVGPRSFFFGLGSILVAAFIILGKTLKVLCTVLDVLDLIFSILSLFG